MKYTKEQMIEIQKKAKANKKPQADYECVTVNEIIAYKKERGLR